MFYRKIILISVLIIFGICIENVDSFERFQPIRASIKSIPIRPLDHSTIQRLTRRPVPINPDAEPIYVPLHGGKYKPYQIMERISSPSDVNTNRNSNTNTRNTDFNFLNFDAYMVKPKDFNYNNVLATIKPETERILRLMNQTDNLHGDDAKPSSSSNHNKYRTKNPSKKPKRNNQAMQQIKAFDFDDYDYYKAYVEHQKQAAAMKKLKLKHAAQLNNPNKYSHTGSKLPIGIDFFEQRHKNNKMAFPPITYSPLYMNNLHRSHRHEEAEASNIHINTQRLEMLQDEEMPTTTVATYNSLAPTALPITVDIQQENNEQKENTIAPSDHHLPEEAKSYHNMVSLPEMYKFTIDDAIIRPHISNTHAINGPVTLTPPNYRNQHQTEDFYIHSENAPLLNVDNIQLVNIPPLKQRAAHRNRLPNQFNGPHFHAPVNYPPNENSKNGYRRLERIQYQHQQYHMPNIPMEHQASVTSRRQVPVKPIIMTTQMSVTTDNNSDNDSDQSVKAATQIDSKRIEKRMKKRRPPTKDNHQNNSNKNNSNNIQNANDDNAQNIPNQQNSAQNNNLEFSTSYTKRRTQGYNSEEETQTTPISPLKLKNTKSQLNESIHGSSDSEQQQIQQQQQHSHTEENVNEPRVENAKYFQ